MTEHHNSASKYIKGQGLPSLIHVADAAQIDRQLLHTWYRTKPALFEIIVAGCTATYEDCRPKSVRLAQLTAERDALLAEDEE